MTAAIPMKPLAFSLRSNGEHPTYQQSNYRSMKDCECSGQAMTDLTQQLEPKLKTVSRLRRRMKRNLLLRVEEERRQSDGYIRNNSMERTAHVWMKHSASTIIDEEEDNS